jgi:hypothetical protein
MLNCGIERKEGDSYKEGKGRWGVGSRRIDEKKDLNLTVATLQLVLFRKLKTPLHDFCAFAVICSIVQYTYTRNDKKQMLSFKTAWAISGLALITSSLYQETLIFVTLGK